MERIFIHDVVARDGLQIEPAWMPTERKIELIDRLSATGVAKIEATSFVSPKAVPNLRDAEAVMAGINRNPAVTYVALVPNARGAERALGADVDEIVLVVSVSETHNRANVRRSVAESFVGFGDVFDVVRGHRQTVVSALAGLRARAALSHYAWHGPGECSHGARRGSYALRGLSRWTGRMPVRARRDGKYLHRRSGAHAALHGLRHRNRSRPLARNIEAVRRDRRTRASGPSRQGGEGDRFASGTARSGPCASSLTARRQCVDS